MLFASHLQVTGVVPFGVVSHRPQKKNIKKYIKRKRIYIIMKPNAMPLNEVSSRTPNICQSIGW